MRRRARRCSAVGDPGTATIGPRYRAPIIGDNSLRDVSFSYVDGLSGFGTFHSRAAGTTTALVGDWRGKSTLVNLLVAFTSSIPARFT